MTPVRVVLLMACLGLGGCTAQAGPSASVSDEAPNHPSPTPDLPPFPGSVGATEWATEAEPPPGMGPSDTTASDPQMLVQQVATLLRDDMANPPTDIRADVMLEGSDTATGLIHIAGVGDDSVAGAEYLLTMSRGARGWYVSETRMRTHCRRGVSGELCV